MEIFTTGYSTRTLAQFITLLKNHRVQQLVDVRTIPKSRHQPDFNSKKLARALKRCGITYLHLPELGGLRKPIKQSINTAWRNDSFRGYADYMQTRQFTSAIRKLIKLNKKKAIMCAEGNPYRCHRSLIADALIARGVKSAELTARGSTEHNLTPFAKLKGTRVWYPR